MSPTCSAGDCERPSRRHGMCPMHHRRWRVAHPDTPRCSLEDCDKPMRTARLCEYHYGRQRRADQSRPRCVTSACNEVVEARGLCHPHYAVARRYGLSTPQFVEMLDSAAGRCASCGSVPLIGLVVDHDHENGVVRALICGPCNLMIGHAGDDPARLIAAATYLLQFQNVLAGDSVH